MAMRYGSDTAALESCLSWRRQTKLIAIDGNVLRSWVISGVHGRLTPRVKGQWGRTAWEGVDGWIWIPRWSDTVAGARWCSHKHVLQWLILGKSCSLVLWAYEQTTSLQSANYTAAFEVPVTIHHSPAVVGCRFCVFNHFCVVNKVV